MVPLNEYEPPMLVPPPASIVYQSMERLCAEAARPVRSSGRTILIS